MSLNDILDQMALTGICRTSHQKTEYMFFSSTHGTFSMIDHILAYKTSFTKSEMTEIISDIFSDHNSIKLEINYKEKTRRNTHMGG